LGAGSATADDDALLDATELADADELDGAVVAGAEQAVTIRTANNTINEILIARLIFTSILLQIVLAKPSPQSLAQR
jgi:hypothetical protein